MISMRSLLSLTLIFSTVVFALFAAGCPASKTTIEILHVNDLHSNFEQGTTPALGGYARLKTELERLKREAKQRGRETIVLNGGDSFEGHPFYYVDKGSESMRLLAAMGFDASVIGNHDWLMGPSDLDRLASQIPAGMNFVGANFKYDAAKYPNLARKMKPYVTFERAGLRIAVIGLATNSLFYKWASQDVEITNPLVRAAELIARLRATNDILIVLSHLGTADDRKLVERTAGIDLIVGAHDHVSLEKPLFVKDLAGRNVPILQGRAFGEAVGQLVITVKRDRTYTVDSYRHVPVTAAGTKDLTIANLVAAASAKLDAQFGSAWLNDPIATSPIALENAEHAETEWGARTAAAFKEAAQADLGLDFGVFHGMSQPAGPVTRKTLMKVYPRMFDFAKTKGWTVWTMQIPGALLQTTLEYANRFGFKFQAAGATFRWETSGGKQVVRDLKINGTDVDPAALYTIALPEGITRGLIEVPRLFEKPLSQLAGETASDIDNVALAFIAKQLAAFNHTIRDTGIPVIEALERELTR